MVDIEAELARNPQSINALKVVNRLASQGFQAYLVGGCVRDLLLGSSPKDYDVATDAHPEDVRQLFSNSRSIGRRFKIVHVRFGRDIIEVATFRAPPAVDRDDHISDGGRILSDNIYGSFEEDVMRRDFTINALYYNPENKQIIDLVDGMGDIEKKTIRLIGDPENRFREDPVRMLRAARFEAKLGFDLEAKTMAQLKKLGFLLQDIPPARLFEEVLKLFMSGQGEASFNSLRQHELLGWLFPAINNADEIAFKLIGLALASTDKRINEGLPVTPAFIYAALLWWPFCEEREKLKQAGQTNLAASHEAALTVIAKQQLFTSIPRRFSGPMRDIWQLQARLPNTRGKKPEILMGHKRFRAAYDFLLLRELSGEPLDGLGEWWTNYQEQNPEQRQAMQNSTPPKSKRRRKRRPRRAQ